MAIYFLIDLSLRAIEITQKSVFEFLIAFLASEILKNKDMTQRLTVRHLGYLKNHDVTTMAKFVFFKEHIGKMCNVKNSWISIYSLLT